MTKSQADAQLQSAALRHYAVMCREKARLILSGQQRPNMPECGVEWLSAKAERADKLARIYDLVAEGA